MGPGAEGLHASRALHPHRDPGSQGQGGGGAGRGEEGWQKREDPLGIS